MHEWVRFAICLVALFCISAVSARFVQGSEVEKIDADTLDNNSGSNFSYDGNNLDNEKSNSKLSQSNSDIGFSKKNLTERRRRLSKRNARLLRERDISRNSYSKAQKQSANYERKLNQTLSTVVGRHKIQVSTRWRDFDVHSYDNGHKIIIKPLLRHEIEIIPEENVVYSPVKVNKYDPQLQPSTSNSDLIYQNKYPSTATANHRTMSYEDYVKYFTRKDERLTTERTSVERFSRDYDNVQEYGSSGIKPLKSVYTDSYKLSSDEFTHGYRNQVKEHENSVKYPGTKPLTSVTTELYKLPSDKLTHGFQNKVKEFENSIKYSETKPLSSLNTESYKLSSTEFAHDYESKVKEFESETKYSRTTPLNSINTGSYKISTAKEFATDYESKVKEFENPIEYSEKKPLKSVSTESNAQIFEQKPFTSDSKNEVTNENAIDETLNEKYTEVSTTDDMQPTTGNIGGFEKLELKTVQYTGTEEHSKITNVIETTSLNGSGSITNGTEKDDFNGFEASGFFPVESSLEENLNTADAFEDSLGDLANQLGGSSGSEEVEFESGLNRSGKIFGLFSAQSEFSKCSTPKGEAGHCRRFRDCLLSDALNNFNNFLQYLCLIRGTLVGICCPDNPVIEVTDAEPQNSTEPLLQDIKLPPDGCGINSNETRTRIVGGKVSTPHEWTWMVALMRKNKFYCGGVIINNWYVLTAAHCVLGMNVRDLKVRLGEYNFNSKTNHQRDISVAEIKRHAQFVTLTFQHDIALLKLTRRIEYTKFVGSICLPGQEGRDYSDINGTVVGWGTVSFGGAVSSVLREVTIPVWKNEECDRIYLLENIGDSFLCAGSPDNGEDACQGDSGGPLMALNESGRWEVIGIVSWGRRCGDPTYPGVYTRVTSYLDWIRENAH